MKSRGQGGGSGKQRSVLVTGCSGGIGRSIALTLSKNGWRVFGGVRQEHDADSLIKVSDGSISPIFLDVRYPDQIEEAVRQIRLQAGPLFALVNNAGVAIPGPVEVATADDWREVFDVNLFGVVDLTRAFLPDIIESKGRVVNIGSVGGRIAVPLWAANTASRHALAGFSWTLRGELKGTGATSIVVEPGQVATDLADRAGRDLDSMANQLTGMQRDRYWQHLAFQTDYSSATGNQGITPQAVAEVVVKALGASRPRARYLAGPDAVGVNVLTRMPDRFREAVLALSYRAISRISKR